MMGIKNVFVNLGDKPLNLRDEVSEIHFHFPRYKREGTIPNCLIFGLNCTFIVLHGYCHILCHSACTFLRSNDLSLKRRHKMPHLTWNHPGDICRN